MLIIFCLTAGLFLAYGNGANDNFKGVATLYGSGTTSYRSALGWSTVTTFAGSVAALFVARGLLITFSGKGLVSESVLAMPAFPVATALAAALTVMTATRLGFPISTTHALIGALLGAGLRASAADLDLSHLGSALFLPLLASPVVALLGALLLYPIMRFFRKKLGVKKTTRIRLSLEPASPALSDSQTMALQQSPQLPSVRIDSDDEEASEYSGQLLGLHAKNILDSAHYLSAGAVCFARGLNDTPKIAAILLAASVFSNTPALLLVGLAMVIGGLIHASRVAETVSHKVTRMNAGQGFTANLVTAGIVIAASRFSLPVSTTHVSCGTLIGIGTVTKSANWKKIAEILLAWAITLPVAMVLGYLCFVLVKAVTT